ncbi:hypothetical protein [Malacoplasma muris]|uniref:hypothetical protein n=1 Tax=Malacoplasma muris TaxID=2119 RepID=UPI00398F4DDF
MKVRKVEKKDYNQLVLHAKNVINYYDFFDNYNDELNTGLATFLLNNMIRNVNYGYVIEYNGLIVGVLLASIPDYKHQNIFSDQDLIDLNVEEADNINFFKTLDDNQEEIKNLEIYTNQVYYEMFQKYSDIVSNRSEILMFSILPKHRGRGLSDILYNKFKFDIIEYGYPDFCLFTTTNCDYGYYEHKKLQFVKEIMYDSSNVNEELAKFLSIPMFGIIYYGNANAPKEYDGVAEEIIEENNQ